MALTYEIVTPEKRVAQGPCDEVRAAGVLGSFGIRAGHVSFMSSLQPGALVVTAGGRDEVYAVGGGFLQVDKDRIIVLADTVEARAEIDVERARRALADATGKLGSLTNLDSAYAGEAARAKRAAARLSVAGK